MAARRYRQFLGRRLLLLVVTAAAGLGAGWVTAPKASATYFSTAVIFVDPSGVGSTAGGSEALAFDQLMDSYCLLFPDTVSAQQAVSSASLARSPLALRSETRAALVANSDLIRLTVNDRDRAVSARAADALATELAQAISSGANGLTAAPAHVVQGAQTAELAPAGNRRRIVEDGILGLVVGVAVLVGIEVARGTVRRPQEVESRVGLPVLAVLPFEPAAADRPDGAGRSPGGLVESVRAAATTLARRAVERPTVMVSSAATGEGKTTVCAAVGGALAAAGLRCVLVDLNFRQPRLHQLLGGANQVGAAQVIAGTTPLTEALQQLPVGENQVTLLAAGPDADPALLVRQDRLAELLHAVSENADFVLVDTPALILSAESLAVGGLCGSALLVAEARRRALPRLERARDLLERNRVEVVGVVLDTLG